MLDMTLFGEALKKMGCFQFSGVPCSYLSPMINYAINENSFIMSNNEGDATAIATGISLANMKQKDKFGVVLMQNSGLSNALSPLTSLNDTFEIPILGFVSLRGERDMQGKNTDEPQHELLGIITDRLLKTCNIAYDFLSQDYDQAIKQLNVAHDYLKKQKSYFFIVKNNTFKKCSLTDSKSLLENQDQEIIEQNHNTVKLQVQRIEILKYLSDFSYKNNIALFATTGKTGRELYEIQDTENQLYMVGSMGCVSSLALGVSLQNFKKVIAIDGDSALLMRMGALSTNAYYSKLNNKGNFCHVLLDNESHDSTGGQFNLSPFVNFSKIAYSCGYEKIFIINSFDDLAQALNFFLDREQGGAILIYIKILKGSKENLGRPKVTPKQVALRIAQFLIRDEHE
ncbi:phosphonopyruvate decarboxylase [Campylobacter hepaticus]|uniref:Phosphonopyruvate decarboxylase n=1 Tax=Campylobacter hepaticus TaxID=1813019 RepID=A0A6A7JSV1_9BACT|nr:phosphonopyruvate decarboxylase [Campylobacter hepaticus]AXP09024.1 phosphonopyruvate decarboxylase [Campylobacter hepaticus]MCZ0771935.1 phosphonopyruvate decarboxylase [Campylobacter hepaticus]MCZ0773404.1 phosphonopyruvate decarboxylase [Campylobacter hepaticus]MCZ0774654.1 phosphonopyruvate decarboxylase [Campylobacter hepaticus]MDX2323730.1 phosphonopyruvate decarboxylase [Campylobacter hepaticus]